METLSQECRKIGQHLHPCNVRDLEHYRSHRLESWEGMPLARRSPSRRHRRLLRRNTPSRARKRNWTTSISGNRLPAVNSMRRTVLACRDRRQSLALMRATVKVLSLAPAPGRRSQTLFRLRVRNAPQR